MRVCVTALMCAGYCLGSFVESFDTGAGGWGGTFGSQHSISQWSSTGGNPDGYLWNTDRTDSTAFSTYSWYFASPLSVNGDHSDASGGYLSFQLKAEGDSSGVFTPNAQDADIRLQGSSLTIGYFGLLPTSSWTHYSIPLEQSSWRKWNGVEYRTDNWNPGDFEAVLSNVTSLWIRGNYYDGVDRTGIDNIVLTAVPEPATMAPAGIAALLVLFRTRRR